MPISLSSITFIFSFKLKIIFADIIRTSKTRRNDRKTTTTVTIINTVDIDSRYNVVIRRYVLIADFNNCLIAKYVSAKYIFVHFMMCFTFDKGLYDLRDPKIAFRFTLDMFHFIKVPDKTGFTVNDFIPKI